MSNASQKTKILAVPTNIITGFLGIGKTSTILHLLKSKPANERWAVLVNEFGTIGIDGSLYQGLYSEENGIFIREVQGGCMCCTANLPMQIALNQLLAAARPHRLLIEPTGLGHPLEILQELQAKHYRDVLSIQKILTLVDARKLTQKRYTEHETFNQQIAIADVIVGNKADRYTKSDRENLKAYSLKQGNSQAKLLFTEYGELDQSYLEGSTSTTEPPHFHNHQTKENFESIGWRFPNTLTFDKTKVLTFLNTLNAERIKAVFITEQGKFAFNLVDDSLSEIPLNSCIDSRIEILAEQTNPEWEEQISECFYMSHCER